MENIQGNGKIVLPGPISAIIDTGSNFIFGDIARVEKLHAALGGKYIEDGYFTYMHVRTEFHTRGLQLTCPVVKCNSIPEVSLTFHGRSFSIAPDVLNQGQVEYGSSDCFSGILGLEENLRESFDSPSFSESDSFPVTSILGSWGYISTGHPYCVRFRRQPTGWIRGARLNFACLPTIIDAHDLFIVRSL